MFVTSYFLVSCIFIQNVYMFEVPLEVEPFDGYDIDVGSALFLTPLIKQDKIFLAQNSAKVRSFLKEDIVSYSGFLTVDEKKESNLHFWFFPAKQNWTHASTVVWFHSGTGVSAIQGLFTANGPYGLSDSNSVIPRKFSWTDYFNVVYMDCPVGTGYSFTKYRNGYSTCARDVAENAAEGLHQFYQLFPQIKGGQLILSGQSLFGQFLPYIAYFLHDPAYKQQYNVPDSIRIVAGNPIFNLGSQLVYTDQWQSMGLIGKGEREQLHFFENRMKFFKQSEKYENATDIFNLLFNPAYTRPNPTYLEKLTGLNQNENFINYSNETIDLSHFLNHPSTREKLHVGNVKWKKDRRVYDFLKKAVFEPPRIRYEHVFQNKIPTLFCIGQADLVVPPIAIEKALSSLSWYGARDYEYSLRNKLFYNNKLVGTYKASNDVVTVVVRNAGHNAAADRPGYVKAILKDFESGVFDDKGDPRARD